MAVTFLAPVLHLFCLCFLSQDFSDPPIRSGIAFPALDSGLGPVTCFDWWDVSTCDISRGLKPACDRLAFWQVYYRERKASLPGAVPSAGPQKEQAWSRPGSNSRRKEAQRDPRFESRPPARAQPSSAHWHPCRWPVNVRSSAYCCMHLILGDDLLRSIIVEIADKYNHDSYTLFRLPSCTAHQAQHGERGRDFHLLKELMLWLQSRKVSVRQARGPWRMERSIHGGKNGIWSVSDG